MANRKKFLREVALEIPKRGIKGAIKYVAVKMLIARLIAKSAFFGLGPITFVLQQALGWVVSELMDEIVQGVRNQLSAELVRNDFTRYHKVRKKQEVIEANPKATKEDLDALDDEIRNAIDDAIRIGRM